MKRLVWGVLLAALAAPAYAGHGTIEETDDAFIVEYSGDASDKAPEKGNAGASSSSQQAQASEAPSRAPSKSYEVTQGSDTGGSDQVPERRRPRRGRYRGPGQATENPE